MNGDAADGLVRMMLHGTEMVIRLIWSAAKNLAALLIVASVKTNHQQRWWNQKALAKGTSGSIPQ